MSSKTNSNNSVITSTKKRASAKNVIPEKSKVKEVRDIGSLAEPITIDMDTSRPVSFMENPEEIVPHEQIPANIKTSIIDTYGEKFFVDKEWTRGKLTKLARSITHPRENLTHSIAQICGPNCTMADQCPYDIVGKPPIGERCPIELKMSNYLYTEYSIAVSERLGKDIDEINSDIIIHNLINGIVEADMVEARLNGSIAEEGFLTEVPTVVNEQTGEVFTKQEESVAVRIKERVARRKDQLYRQLLATPEMAEKYKKKGDSDAVARGAKLLDRLEKLADSYETTKIKDGEVSN